MIIKRSTTACRACRQRAGRRCGPSTVGDASRSGLRGNTAAVRPRTPPTSVSLAPRRPACTTGDVIPCVFSVSRGPRVRPRRQFSRVARLFFVFFFFYTSFFPFTFVLTNDNLCPCVRVRVCTPVDFGKHFTFRSAPKRRNNTTS